MSESINNNADACGIGERLPKQFNKKLYVTIIGGGNTTAIFATLAKLAGHDVAILTRRPEAWGKEIGFKNQDSGYLNGVEEFSASVDCVTSDPSECIPQSDFVFIGGVPIHHNPEILKNMVSPHLNREKEVLIGTVCAYGGFNWVARDSLGEGKYIVIGCQLIPWCCGTLEYGKRGVVFGAKRMLRIATEGGVDTHGSKALFRDILQIENTRDTDFLTSTFWPNNPSLHPPILYGLFSKWDGKTSYSRNDVPTMMYTEITDECETCMIELDNELNAIVEALRKVFPENKHLTGDFHLKACIEENYLAQVHDSSTLGTVVRTCDALGSHKLPYKEVAPGQVVPLLAHKFFETDLPFGLCIWKDVALMLGVDTPLTDKIIDWNQKLINKEYLKDGKICGKDAGECVIPSKFGLTLATLERNSQ